MSERCPVEETREYIIANAVPMSDDEEKFIAKYKYIYEMLGDAFRTGDTEALLRELGYLNSTPIAMRIYQRERDKKDDALMRYWQEQEEEKLRQVAIKYREERKKAVAAYNERMHNSHANTNEHRDDCENSETRVVDTKPKKRFDNSMKTGLIICVTLGFFFLLSVCDLDYGYYNFMRVFAFLMSVVCAVIFFRKQGFSAIHIPIVAICVLWNPIAPVYMDKETWVIFDVIAALIEFGIGGYIYYNEKRGE